ncbi:MAG: hypothetical protein KF767_07350 [Bdellovibrionaceae bacterium]|nr:hypothetical protein [Pseudobdellovibrionaceae bacterium]
MFSFVTGLLIFGVFGVIPAQAHPECVRECGTVQTYLGVSGEERLILEVETGFDWERGMVSKSLFELRSAVPGMQIHFQQELLDQLSSGDSICVTGAKVTRVDRIPALVPFSIEGMNTSRSAEYD